MSAPRLSRTQRIILALTPKSWHTDMEAESRRWMVRCPCGHERSIWAIGGIRWKGSSGSKTATYGRCPACGQRTWQTLHYRPDAATGEPG